LISSRKAFLAISATGVISGPAVASAQSATPSTFDATRFRAALARKVAHRQVFAAESINGGAVIRHAFNAIEAYQGPYGEAAGTYVPLVVLYGSAAYMALDAPAWQGYDIRKKLEAIGDVIPGYLSKAGNPFITDNLQSRTTGALTRNLPSLQSQGGIIVVCNNSLRDIAVNLANGDFDKAPSVFQYLKAAIYKDVHVVPAGIAAINDAQEAGFTYSVQ